MNSWTAGPGEMPYDDDYDGPAFNARCSQCGRPFRIERDAIGSLCDDCCTVRDADRVAQALIRARLIEQAVFSKK